MQQHKVTYIISDIDKAIAFEWIAQQMDKERFALSFILLNAGGSVFETFLKQNGFNVYHIKCSGKKDWPGALIKTWSLLRKLKPSTVHCHLIQANIIGLMAAKLARVKNRIYTRHHSSLHHVYFPKGIWWDRLANRLSTHIIAISAVVKNILVDWERVDEKKVFLIPHGFEVNTFREVGQERLLGFNNRHSLEKNSLIIGVVSRFTEWKGVHYIIPAFKKLLLEMPNAILLLLNASGDYENHIKVKLQEMPESCFRIIKFENDIAAAYKAMDIFIHVPIDDHSEAFGQIYVEALAAGVPSIFTLSGIAQDFIKHERNAYVVPFKESDAIYQAMKQILADKEKAKSIAEQGAKDVRELFSLKKMIHSLESLYDSN